MNVDDIKANFKQYARSNFYRIRFNRVGTEAATPPDSRTLLQQFTDMVTSMFGGPGFQLADAIDIAIDTAVFPSIGMSDVNATWKGFKIPISGSPELGDLSVTFLCDGEMLIYQYFIEWMQIICDPESGKAAPTSQMIYDHAMIYQVGNDLKYSDKRYKVKLNMIHPIEVGEIQLGSDEGIMKFDVKFKYLTIGNDLRTTKERKSGLLDMIVSKVVGSVGG